MSSFGGVVMNGGRGTGWVVVQLVLFAAIALVPSLGAWPGWAEQAGLVAGILCGLLGSVLSGVSALQLGGNLTIFPRPKGDGTLVTHGVYTLTRHPIYSGVLLMALGLALVRASTPGLVLALILAVFIDQKAAREEIWLRQKFPEYEGYAQRVKKLIPWIY
ncbi:MAG TPA: isoprenylcysteine carboxylmethyltransferase family protein [Roseiflexaceae bacterium]|nr:isoprenylcysteine carboxylmethyltransferase family protein [Roseiflexaceae bacterium]